MSLTPATSKVWTWITYRGLYPLEFFLCCSQGYKLVRTFHLDGGRVRWGPIGYPLQQETSSTKIKTPRTQILLTQNILILFPRVREKKFFVWSVRLFKFRANSLFAANRKVYFQNCLLMQWIYKLLKNNTRGTSWAESNNQKVPEQATEWKIKPPIFLICRKIRVDKKQK